MKDHKVPYSTKKNKKLETQIFQIIAIYFALWHINYFHCVNLRNNKLSHHEYENNIPWYIIFMFILFFICVVKKKNWESKNNQVVLPIFWPIGVENGFPPRAPTLKKDDIADILSNHNFFLNKILNFFREEQSFSRHSNNTTMKKLICQIKARLSDFYFVSNSWYYWACEPLNLFYS